MMDYVAKDVPLWSVTTWDKKFIGVDRSWQPKTIKYKYLLSAELDRLNVGGDVYLLYTGQDEGYTNEDLAGDAVCSGEIVSIPWGGTPSVKYYNGKFVTGDNRIATSNDPNELLNRFLYYFMKGRIKEISSYYRGAGLKHPSMKSVLSMRISYPAVEKQKDIIAQFESIENILSLFQLKLDSFDELVKSRFIEMFGDPLENPFEWDVAPLGELGELKNGVNFKSVDSGTEIRCLGVGDFKDRYQISDMGLISIVSLNGKPNESQMLRDGDIVFVRSNGNKKLVGRCLAIFPGDEEVTFSGFCIRFRNKSDKLLLDYMLGCLKSDPMRKAMTGRGANIQNLSQKILSEVVMPIPPLALQQEFAAFVRQVDKLEFETQQAIDKLQMLYDSLAQEYFAS